ncbi:MAG TPA: outer membrane lipoprotein chaperone LolA [Casimicrobiaceae bacterium]|nr:outer membrane lipoprotein chaperone LolA [Casimicrobiaceae bacterium]
MVLLRIGAIVALAFPLAVFAASLDRLRSFVRDTQTARTPFTQTVTDKAGRVVQKSNGEFQLARPGKFRWSVDKPYRQLVVGDGDRVWIYDEDLNQVIVRKAGEAIGSTPAALLAGREDVERAFKWRELPASGGLEWLAAMPIAKDAAFAEIRLGFIDKTLAALELTDPFGQTTVVRFGAFERNPTLASDTFRFVPPKGADVIGER